MKKFRFDSISKYRSILFGIMIISIIIFHYTYACQSANYNNQGWVHFYNEFIWNTGVDLFLLLSGFGLYYSFKKNNNIKKFYKKRLIKILIPYVMFCVPVLIWKYYFFLDKGFIEVIKQVTFYSFFTDGSRMFWYILMICICYLIFPYLFKVVDTAKDEMTLQMRILNIITALLLFNIMLDLYYYRPLYANINIALLRFAPFVFGVYLGKKAYKKEKIPYSYCLIFILCSFLFVFLKDSGRIILLRNALMFFAMGLTLIIILLLSKIDGTKFYNFIKRILEKIGEYTLELYITHVGVVNIFEAYGIKVYRIRYYLLVILVSIILSIILKKLSNIIINYLLNKKTKKIRKKKKKKTVKKITKKPVKKQIKKPRKQVKKKVKKEKK